MKGKEKATAREKMGGGGRKEREERGGGGKRRKSKKEEEGREKEGEGEKGRKGGRRQEGGRTERWRWRRREGGGMGAGMWSLCCDPDSPVYSNKITTQSTEKHPTEPFPDGPWGTECVLTSPQAPGNESF